MVQRGEMFKKQRSDQPDDGKDNLFQPMRGNGATTGEFGQNSKTTSLYTRYLEQHPARQFALLGGAFLGALALTRRVGR
jgi:hypothetical protein